MLGGLEMKVAIYKHHLVKRGLTMNTVRVYNENCILAGQAAPDDAPDGDTTEYITDDVAWAHETLATRPATAANAFRRRTAQTVIDHYGQEG